MPEFEIDLKGQKFRIEADTVDQAVQRAKTAQPKTEKPGFWQRLKSTVTGEGRTEFPEAPEFLDAFIASGAGNYGGDASAIQRSAITSDPAAQVDILRKNIPGLQTTLDKHNNVMLKAPGMKDWAYLNKPGFSSRDIDEFFTPILATMPFLGSAGVGGNLGTRMVTGGGMMGLAELEQEGLAKLAGSEQGPSTAREALALGGGAFLAPGVPTAALAGGRSLLGKVTAPLPRQEAERRVGGAFEQGVMSEERQGLTEGAAPGKALGTQAPRFAPRRPGEPMTPETARAEAASRLQGKAGKESPAVWGEDTRLMDIGGEPTRALARSAANLNPEARQTLNQVIDPRFERQNERASAFLEGLVGEKNAQSTREQLDQIADSIVSPAYRKAMESGRRGVPTAIIADMLQKSRILQGALRKGAAEMKERSAAGRMESSIIGENEWFTLETWDQAKRALQDIEGRLLRQGARSQAANVGNIRRELTRVLTEAYPEYSNALSISERVFESRNALEAGENFVTSKLNNDAARVAHNEMSREEQELFRVGYVSRLVAKIREPGAREDLMKLFKESPASLERLEIALGPHGAREFEAFLATERLMDHIRRAVQGNSTTARQLVELGLASSAGGLASGMDPKNWQAALIVGFATRYGINRGMTARDNAVAREIAEMLTSRNPDVIYRGLQRLAQPEWLKRLRALDQAVGSDLGSRVGRNIAIQGLQARGQKDTRPAPSKGADDALGGRMNLGAAVDNPREAFARVEGDPGRFANRNISSENISGTTEQPKDLNAGRFAEPDITAGNMPGAGEVAMEVPHAVRDVATGTVAAIQDLANTPPESFGPRNAQEALTLGPGMLLPYGLGRGAVGMSELGEIELGAFGAKTPKSVAPKPRAVGGATARPPQTYEELRTWHQVLRNYRGDVLGAAEELGIRDAVAETRLGDPAWQELTPQEWKAREIDRMRQEADFMRRHGIKTPYAKSTLEKEFGPAKAAQAFSKPIKPALQSSVLNVPQIEQRVLEMWHAGNSPATIANEIKRLLGANHQYSQITAQTVRAKIGELESKGKLRSVTPVPTAPIGGQSEPAPNMADWALGGLT